MEEGRTTSVDGIQDENILREMWKEASDPDEKRKIRSRMYKLREQRLKDLYNREGILENILKNDEEEEGSEPKSLEPEILIPHGVSARNIEPEEQIRPPPSPSQEVLKSIINQTDRTRQLREIRDGVRQRGTNQELIPKRPKAISNKGIGKTGTSKAVANGTEHVRGNSRGPSPAKLVEKERNIQNVNEQTKGSDPEKRIPSNKVTKGMLSPPVKKRVTKLPASPEPSTSPSRKVTTPRFMAPTKSRENAGVPNPNVRESSRVAMRATTAPVVNKPTKGKASTPPAPTTLSHQSSLPTSPRSAVKKTASNQILKESKVTSKGGSQPIPTREHSPLQKKNTEDFIIQELDNLDSFLAQRSTSIEEKKLPSKEDSKGTKKKPKMDEGRKKEPDVTKKGRPTSPPKVKIDVQESGEEPIVTRSVYKYGHADPGTSGVKHSGSKDSESKLGQIDSKTLSSRDTKTQDMGPRLTDSASGYHRQAENYEKDILSRPSIFDKKASTPSTEIPGPSRGRELTSKVKRFDDEDEMGQGTSKISRTKILDTLSDEDLDFPRDELIGAQASRGSLKSPGAVLKARNMFEEKAHESAMDRASTGFQSKTYTSKVTKKTAIFEARSRGERVSISSESSSHVTAPDGNVDEEELSVPPPPSPGNSYTKMIQHTKVTTEGQRESDVPRSSMSPPRVTSRPEIFDLKIETDKESSPPSSASKGKVARSNSKSFDARVEAVQSRGSSTTTIPSRLTPAFISSLDDLTMLEMLLEEAKSYDERSNIRARVREIRRGQTMKSVTVTDQHSHRYVLDRNPPISAHEFNPPEPREQFKIPDPRTPLKKPFIPGRYDRDNTADALLVVRGTAIKSSRKPRSPSPDFKKFKVKFPTKKGERDEVPREVDSKIHADRSRKMPVLAGKSAPSTRQSIELPTDRQGVAKVTESEDPLSLKVVMSPPLKGLALSESDFGLKRFGSVKSQSLDTEPSSTVLTYLKKTTSQRKSLAEPTQTSKGGLTVEDFLAKESPSSTGFSPSSTGFSIPSSTGFSIPSVSTTSTRPATGRFSPPPSANIRPSQSPVQKNTEKSWKYRGTKTEQKNYVVGHVTVDPPSTGFQRVANNLELITSSYGVGPTDDNGRPLFGLKALRKVKELQDKQVATLDTNGNEVEPVNGQDEKECDDMRTNDLFGLRALRKMSMDGECNGISSSAPHGLDLEETKRGEGDGTMKPKSILKKTSSFSSNGSESKPDFGGIFETTDEEVNRTTPSPRTERQLTSSLPQLTEGPSEKVSSDDPSRYPWKRNNSAEPCTSNERPQFDPKDVLLEHFGFIPPRRGASSVREMSKKFESPKEPLPVNGNATKPFKTLPARHVQDDHDHDHVQDKPDQEVAQVDQPSSSQGSGRSFLNDRSAVTGIPDVLDRMKWTPRSVGSDMDQDTGLQLLNKFLGASILMDGLGSMEPPKKLEDCEEDEKRSRIETRLATLGAAGGSVTVSKKGTRSADVTGELMPFILGQLQASLESISSASGGGGGGGSLLRQNSGEGTSGSQILNSSPSSNASPSSSSHQIIISGNGGSPPKVTAEPVASSDEPQSGGPDECLFDSGTESGEDVDPTPPPKKQSPPAEFSSFMEGLRHSLTREGGGLLSSLSGTQLSGSRKWSLPTAGKVSSHSASPPAVPESDLIQQVEKVLSLLKESLIKDPNALSQTLLTGVTSGTELIALIDRLKSSLQTTPEVKLPCLVGSPSPPKDPPPPDLISGQKLPWAAVEGGEGPWKLRAAKKRALVRSRSIGVSNEELEEARRHMQEEAFRSALRDEPKSEGEVTKRPGRDAKSMTSDQHPNKRLSTSSYDGTSLRPFECQKLKPFARTFSLDSNPMTLDDPSSSFFTPQEVVQIAIHKAAINKQVSQEEDRRRRSLVTPPPSLPRQGTPITRDFTLALPKPYVPPSTSSSDEHEVGPGGQRRQSGTLVISNPSKSGSSSLSNLSKRGIENVQISLKETGDIPQLQIAITLNTNSNGSQEGGSKKRFESEEREGRGQGEGSSDDSTKGARYANKSERRKKMKRANTLDVLPSSDFDLGDENEESEDENVQPVIIAPVNSGAKKGVFFLDKTRDPPPKPGFLSAHDNYWNNRFSTLKTSFESSSQGSSPSISPIPAGLHHSRLQATAGPPQAQMNFKPSYEPNLMSPTKPVWATASSSPEGHSPSSSVRNKLSVFENRSDGISPSFLKMGEQSPQLGIKSGILQKRESFEKKFEGMPQVVPVPTMIPRKPIGKQFEQPMISMSHSHPPTIYEGVHTVHATKSAMEAMQHRQQNPPPPIPPRINQNQQSAPITKQFETVRPMWEIEPHPPPTTHFDSSSLHFSSDPPPIPPKSNIALKKLEFENVQQFGAPRAPSLVKQRTMAIEASDHPASTHGQPPLKMSVFGLAKSFDEAARHKGFEFSNPSSFGVPVPSSRRESLEERQGADLGVMNSPVVSKVMRGPQQQRATFSNQEISSLGPNHPSADRIRNSQARTTSFQSQQESQPKFPIFSPRSLQQSPLSKSRSGDMLGFLPAKGPSSNLVQIQPTPPPVIPRQKSLSEFPLVVQDDRGPPAKPAFQPQSFSGMSWSQHQNVSASNPSLPTSTPRAVGPLPSSHDHLKRTSSGSSIFDRAKSLYISSRDAQGIAAPKAVLNTPCRKPPTLPRTNTIFPKQYEAQMSPESADKKQREVESYFKFQQQEKQVPVPVPVVVPSDPVPSSSHYRGKRDQHRVRKCASQGTILNRQKSYSDGDDEEDNVDQIFESLFKASVESKLAKTSVCGDTTSSQLAEVKATKSATQSKAVEKSASVTESKTPTGSTVVKKQSSVSKSSTSYSSSSSQVSAEKVSTTSSGSPFSKFKALDDQNSVGKSGEKIFQFTNPAVKMGVANAKDGLLLWCQGRTRDYQNVKIENFSSSWSDGLAFCALIHHFYKDAFDYDSLSPQNRKHNFELAFRVADERGGIYPLLDPEDMVLMGRKPDWKCVFTYVQSMYQKLKDV